MPFEADYHEPPDILRMLEPAIVDMEVKALNAEGWADYRYDAAPCFCHESTVFNCERKTWGDLTNGIEEIEEQLGRQLDAHPGVHHRLYIEGVAEPAVQGIYLYTQAKGQSVMKAGLKGNKSQTYKNIMAWLHQVGKYWEVVWTNSYSGTASTIVAHYNADQDFEDSHKTFHRYFKERHFNMDPQVAKVLGAAPKGFGPEAAAAVVKRFGTAWRAFKAEPEEWMTIPGIGEITARKYLRELGRGDA